MRGAWKLGWMLLLASGLALATGPTALEKKIEASMLVTGSIGIEPDGKASSHRLDQAETLPKGVAEHIAKVLPTWRFNAAPASGEAVSTQSRMTLRIVARQLDDENVVVRVAGATFVAHDGRENMRTVGALEPPRYPQDAAFAEIGGVVYLVLRIGRDGGVQDVVAEQVNMKVLASEGRLKRWRGLLARAAIVNARSWRFSPPTQGPDKDLAEWSIRVPVDFVAPGKREVAYGEWESYMPGPRQSVPWEKPEETARVSPDAVAAGSIHFNSSHDPHLVTPLEKS